MKNAPIGATGEALPVASEDDDIQRRVDEMTDEQVERALERIERIKDRNRVATTLTLPKSGIVLTIAMRAGKPVMLGRGGRAL